MTTRDFVDALALLLSDESLRERFAEDRGQVIEELGLSESDASLLEQININDLTQQAKGLLSKRRSEVARLARQTWLGLGDQAAALFDEYANAKPWPTGHARHLFDAIEFCAFVDQLADVSANSAELLWLRFVKGKRRFAMRWVTDAMIAGTKQRALLLFYRLRKDDPRRLAWPFGWLERKPAGVDKN